MARKTKSACLRKEKHRGSGGRGVYQASISALPDDLLVSILNQLDARTAVVTSVLSRQWRCLWKSLSDLDFDAECFLPPRYHRLQSRLANMTQGRTFLWQRNCRYILRKYRERAMRVFVKSVSHVLNSIDCPRITSLKLEPYIIEKEKCLQLMDQCVDVAINRDVKEFSLLIKTQVLFEKEEDFSYNFPFWLFSNGRGSSVTKLSLHACRLHISPEFDGFGSITSLSLKEVHLHQENIDNLLRSCRNLEILSLDNCAGFDILRLNSPDLRLKDLTVEGNWTIKEIELFCSKLESMNYSGVHTQLSFEHVPCLNRFVFALSDSSRRGTKYMLGKLLMGLPHITHLELFFKNPRYKIKQKHPPATLSKLKHLSLIVRANISYTTTDLLWMGILLDAAPFLQTFHTCVTIVSDERIREGVLWKPSNFRHHHLKVFTMRSFRGMPNEIAFVRFVLDRVVSLESLHLFSKSNIPLSGELARSLEPLNEKQRTTILEQLRDGIPTNAKIIIS